jgi:MoaA/NifB/PqqE/SkfB family radical SAM enzyme
MRGTSTCEGQLDGRERPRELPFLLAPGGLRLVQIQALRRCNLRCRHCYSESGPDRAGSIPLPDLLVFLRDARALRYGYVGVSGGEPLLWPDLERFLASALDLGFSTSVTTNGTVITPRRARALRPLARLVAVSVDGPEEDHDAMRGTPGAFAAMRRGVAALREAGVPFTVAFTLTRHNVHRLSWTYQFADEIGAAGVEVHPLAGSGAAAVNLPDAVPGSFEFSVAAWLLALLAQRRGPGGPGVILDVIQRAVVERSGWPLAASDRAPPASAPFSDLVPSLVVEPDGRIVPYVYGFPRGMSLGVVGQRKLGEYAEAWRARNSEPLAGVVRDMLSTLAAAGAEYIDLFGELRLSASATDRRESRGVGRSAGDMTPTL